MSLESVFTAFSANNTLKQKPSTTPRAVDQHELEDDHSIHEEEDDYLDETLHQMV